MIGISEPVLRPPVKRIFQRVALDSVKALFFKILRREKFGVAHGGILMGRKEPGQIAQNRF
jgi:hypothetical protein